LRYRRHWKPVYGKEKGGKVSRIDPLAKKIEDGTRLYLCKGLNESIKDHGISGPNRIPASFALLRSGGDDALGLYATCTLE
jgi:hypothetical protein